MNYIEHIQDIIQEIEKIDEKKANKIKDVFSSSFIGTERLMSVTHNLLLLENTAPDIYIQIKDKVNELNRYCKSIGLYISKHPD